jgi:Tfp pilus assembly PilM family ATPase
VDGLAPPLRKAGPEADSGGPFTRQDNTVFRRRAKSLVGLDLGSSAVKAIELKPVGKGYKVVSFGSEPIPPDSIVDGTIVDSTAVVAAIRRLFDSGHIKTKEVAASLSGNAVIVKKISLPVMTEAELAESIYWEAEQYIPFDIQDVNLDYQILDTSDPASKTMAKRGGPRWWSTSTPSRSRTPTRSITAPTPTRWWCC